MTAQFMDRRDQFQPQILPGGGSVIFNKPSLQVGDEVTRL
jgi:hypothetical protein